MNSDKSENYVKYDAENNGKEIIESGKSSGPNGIHPMLLKNCVEEIYKPQSVIFRWLYDQEELPKEWKEAHITSIYKKRDKSEAGNYRPRRPVSLTSVVCKVMEFLSFRIT